jgi:hypothetical protein
MRYLSLLRVVLVLCLPGCTTIGLPNPRALQRLDFGPPEEVRFCVLLDAGVAQEYAEALLRAWNSREGTKYGLFLRPVSFERHPRQGFTYKGILHDLLKIPLGAECDRVIFFVGRHAGDVLYGLAAVNPFLPLPEVLGAVNDKTATHGFVLAALGSPTQLLGELAFQSREDVTMHELYHFVGCGHSYTTMAGCYQRIHTLKERYRGLKSRQYYTERGEEPFFPSVNLDNAAVVWTSRQEVNSALAKTSK